MLPDRPMTIIGRRYLLQDIIGKGGMGAVYRAYDRLTGNTVALKRVITSEMDLSFTSSYDVIDFRVSLAQEFKLLASLRHPNIIAVLDYGFDQDREPYYTMELLDSAHTLLEAGQNLSPRFKVDLMVQMLQALAYLHRRGILHRDLKPANVLVTHGTVKVLDFGLSVMREHTGQTGDDLAAMTSGTLGYMAPEVLMGNNATEAADLYGVGVIGYELFANRHLFPFRDIGQLVNDILYSAPQIDQLDISLPLAQIIQRLLAKIPEDRFQSSLQVIGAFSKALDHSIHIETEATRDSFLQAARFVGREREQDQLNRALRDSVNGKGSLWLIAGESGVGKSRLLEELRTRALVEGGLVIQGHAINTASTPYQLWRPLLGWLPLLRDLNEEEANIIRALVPDVSTLPWSDTPVQSDPRTAQHRLLQLIRETLDTHDQPVLLLLEDLHWAGSESLALLEQLQLLVREMRLMIVTTYRDDETPDLPTHLPHAMVMRLNRLTEEQIGELSAAMLGEAGNQPHVIDLLKRETEGNVFFIIEVIRTLAEEAGHLEQIGLMTLPQQVFAGGMWRIIQRRLEHVPDHARPLLRLAATTGRQLNLALLRQLAPETDLDLWLVVCANAAILEVVDSVWRFTHDKLREGVLDGVSLARRRELHAQVATALEALYGEAAEYVPALAYHWGVAEADAREARYTRLAGEQSLRSGAYREAITYLERTTDLLSKAPASEQFEVKDRLAEAHLGIGGYESARQLYGQNLALAQREGLTLAEADALSHLGDVAQAISQSDAARDFYEQSLALYRQLNDSAGIARALNSLGNVAYDTGDQDTARELYQKSLNLTREIGGQWSMAGAIRSDSGNHHRGAREINQLLGLLEEQFKAGNKVEAVATLYQLGETAQAKDNIGEARDYFRKSASLAREVKDETSTALAYQALGMLELHHDRSQARKHFSTALQAAYETGNQPLGLKVLAGIARYYESSRLDRTIELLAFILYHPDIPDSLQDQVETHVFELEGVTTPEMLETVWERGKNHSFNALTQEILKDL